MLSETPLILTIVLALSLAYLFGMAAIRLGMPAFMGYLLAGVLAGPLVPGLLATPELAATLADLGLVILLFGIGLRFSLRDIVTAPVPAIVGGVVRSVIGGALGAGLGALLGWPILAGIFVGIALTVASSVVVLKIVQDRHLAETERGRIASGWALVEAAIAVLALVLLPVLAGSFGGIAVEDPFVRFAERLAGMPLGLVGVLAVTAIKIAAFIGFMLVVGRSLVPLLLHLTARVGSHELARLAVVAVAVAVGIGTAYLFGVSLPLGAFLAGMILAENTLSRKAAEELLPLRDAFLVPFFIAAGMMFDPAVFGSAPLAIIGALLIVLVVKTAVATGILMLFGRPVSAALAIATPLAQIGEFSLVLAGVGLAANILPATAADAIVATAAISIFLTPLAVALVEWARPAIDARFGAAPAPAGSGGRTEPTLAGGPLPPAPAAAGDTVTTTSLTHHAVLVGYGRVGTVVGGGLLRERRPFVVIEDDPRRAAEARSARIEVIEENGATGRALRRANVAGAEMVIVAIPNAFEAGQIVAQTRKINAAARILVRAHSEDETRHLTALGATSVLTGETQIGLGMLELVHAVPNRPEATAAMAQTAVQKALEPAARIEPEFPIVPAAVAAAASASIEEALGRALALDRAPAEPTESGPPATLEPAIVAEDEAWLYEPAVDPEQVPSDSAMAVGGDGAPADVPSEERLNVDTRAAELVYAGDLPENEPAEVAPDEAEIDAAVDAESLEELSELDGVAEDEPEDHGFIAEGRGETEDPLTEHAVAPSPFAEEEPPAAEPDVAFMEPALTEDPIDEAAAAPEPEVDLPAHPDVEPPAPGDEPEPPGPTEPDMRDDEPAAVPDVVTAPPPATALPADDIWSAPPTTAPSDEIAVPPEPEDIGTGQDPDPQAIPFQPVAAEPSRPRLVEMPVPPLPLDDPWRDPDPSAEPQGPRQSGQDDDESPPGRPREEGS